MTVADIQIICLGTAQRRVLATFRHFKHNKGHPHVLEFDQGKTPVTSIESLLAYLTLRGYLISSLLVLNNDQVVSRSLFDHQ